MTNKERAYNYAKAGWSVFPCLVNAKAPATYNGYKAASTDLEKLDKLFNNPDFNIGFATGKVLVLDFDDVDKVDQFELPDTLTASTPNGGLHYYYKTDQRFQCSQNALADNVDVRAFGGYVLLAPSSLNGSAYEWIHKAPIAQLPNSLSQLMAKKTEQSLASYAAVWTEEYQTRLIERLKVIPCDSRSFWIKIGMAIHHESGGSGDGLEAWYKWFSAADKPGHMPAYSMSQHIKEWKTFQITERGISGAFITSEAKKYAA